MVVINGINRPEAVGVRLSDYLAEAGYKTEQIAVECDGGIISKEDYESKKICDGEIIEIVSFVGGG